MSTSITCQWSGCRAGRSTRAEAGELWALEPSSTRFYLTGGQDIPKSLPLHPKPVFPVFPTDGPAPLNTSSSPHRIIFLKPPERFIYFWLY